MPKKFDVFCCDKNALLILVVGSGYVILADVAVMPLSTDMWCMPHIRQQAGLPRVV